MTVTLNDLALRAGVHPSTISRLANGDPRARVPPETCARVLALLKETGYRPDDAGRPGQSLTQIGRALAKARARSHGTVLKVS